MNRAKKKKKKKKEKKEMMMIWMMLKWMMMKWMMKKVIVKVVGTVVVIFLCFYSLALLLSFLFLLSASLSPPPVERKMRLIE